MYHIVSWLIKGLQFELPFGLNIVRSFLLCCVSYCGTSPDTDDPQNARVGKIHQPPMGILIAGADLGCLHITKGNFYCVRHQIASRRLALVHFIHYLISRQHSSSTRQFRVKRHCHSSRTFCCSMCPQNCSHGIYYLRKLVLVGCSNEPELIRR